MHRFFVHTPKAIRAGEPADRLFVVTSVEIDDGTTAAKGVKWYTAWKCIILPNGMVKHPNAQQPMSLSALQKYKPNLSATGAAPTACFKHDSFYRPLEPRILGLEIRDHIERMPAVVPSVPPTTQAAFDAMSPATQNALYKTRKALPKAAILKLPVGTWVVVKWKDSPDSVCLLISKPDRKHRMFDVLDVGTGVCHSPDFGQIVGTLGVVQTPSLTK